MTALLQASTGQRERNRSLPLGMGEPGSNAGFLLLYQLRS